MRRSATVVVLLGLVFAAPRARGGAGRSAAASLDEHGPLADIKPFALNDQETGRQIASVVMDERVMRETDLLAFEIGVTVGRPSLVMCSYNGSSSRALPLQASITH